MIKVLITLCNSSYEVVGKQICRFQGMPIETKAYFYWLVVSGGHHCFSQDAGSPATLSSSEVSKY